MATKVKVTPLNLIDPKWSVAEAKPGDAVDLSVTVKGGLVAPQYVELKVKGEHGVLATLINLNAAGNTYKGTWTVPNTLGEKELTFDAVLREVPIPLNGHVTSRGKITSPKLKVHGFKVTFKSVDDAFVPKQEKLHVKYDVSGTAPKARFEIWGERYPSGKPLYTEDFGPVSGAKTWDTWDGKANAGVLSGKYITPEFSPYRVRLIVGVDAASVGDPYGAGKGKVCIAEHAFEVKIEHVALRLQKGLAAATTTALETFLKINPRGKNDAYAAKGRLPKDTETARMRVPTAVHQLAADNLDQGGDLVTGAYLAGGGVTKWTRDTGIHTRPELPIEFEPRLTSRDPSKNGAKQGVFEGEAVGPLTLEPFAEEHYHAALYAGASVPATYRRNAAHKVKQGTHAAPVKAAAAPIVAYWQARVKITTAGAQTIDLGAIDADFRYTTGMGELTVYKNRTKLQSNIPAAKLDVEETDATHVKIKAGVTKVGDVVWIVRTPSVPPLGPAVAGWSKYPPGANCHVHYGGARGSAPNYLFRDDFSPAPGAGKQAIIGSGTAWPYKAAIELKPDKPPAGTDEERVEVKALDPVGPNPAANFGLAGVIFSPSFVAGDSYVLAVQLAPFPYQRTLGFFPSKPRKLIKTGPLSVHRVVTIQRSVRMSTVGDATGGYPAGIGNPAEVAMASRPYYGDGVMMDINSVNTELESAFMEWVVPAPAAGTDVHVDINAATYIAAHNAAGGPAGPGAVVVTNGTGNPSDVNNEFVRFDAYRVQLPPGVPMADQAAISAALNALPAGTSSLAAMAAAAPLLGGGGGPGGTPIFAGAGGTTGYFLWLLGVNLAIAQNIMSAATMTPGSATPAVINVVRWPDFYQVWTWNNGAPIAGTYGPGNTTDMHVEGYSAGNGQSYFSTVSSKASVFAHEIGHSLNLLHFAGMNFCWKHHNLMSLECKMSYDWTHGYIPQPPGAVGPVGGAAAKDTGWPDVVPAVIPAGSPAPTAPPAVAGAPTIEIASLVVNDFCPKCALKLRGWKEDVLPVAWRHPDLF